MNYEPYTDEVRGGGRWYPTLITLLNGQILAMSGHPGTGDRRGVHVNDSAEKFSHLPTPTGSWGFVPATQPVNPEDRHIVPYYPRLHVLPGGDVFCCSPRVEISDESGGNERFNPSTGQWTSVTGSMRGQVGIGNGIYWDFGGSRYSSGFTSVLLPLLPPEYRPKILICGDREAKVIDLSVQNPTWHSTSPRNVAIHGVPPNTNVVAPCDPRASIELPRRINLNAVILPTREIFICGGVYDGNGSDCSGVMPGELYDPDHDRWTTLAPARVVRNYHSVALLMPY